jgi:hypothetical protein
MYKCWKINSLFVKCFFYCYQYMIDKHGELDFSIDMYFIMRLHLELFEL